VCVCVCVRVCARACMSERMRACVCNKLLLRKTAKLDKQFDINVQQKEINLYIIINLKTKINSMYIMQINNEKQIHVLIRSKYCY
jgi:ribosomal protein S24E